MRSKDQEFSKKEALYEQRIELLEIQLREAEEREVSQKKMYDRMFQALDESNGGPNSSRNRIDPNSS